MYCSSVYADLLGSQQRPHIRKFAAESFAYLMRKVILGGYHLLLSGVRCLAVCAAVHVAVNVAVHVEVCAAV